MLHFHGEDFIVINIDEVKANGVVKIDNSRVNRFRNSLREQGFLYDLGLREFETLKYRYPSNISIENQSITIIGSGPFVNVFERRSPELCGRLSSVATIWKNTK